jgi:hypothetical protein
MLFAADANKLARLLHLGESAMLSHRQLLNVRLLLVTVEKFNLEKEVASCLCHV